MRLCVEVEIRCLSALSLRTNETVVLETPAALAMSAMVVP